jgi:hypothetical protein
MAKLKYFFNEIKKNNLLIIKLQKFSMMWQLHQVNLENISELEIKLFSDENWAKYEDVIIKLYDDKYDHYYNGLKIWKQVIMINEKDKIDDKIWKNLSLKEKFNWVDNKKENALRSYLNNNDWELYKYKRSNIEKLDKNFQNFNFWNIKIKGKDGW